MCFDCLCLTFRCVAWVDETDRSTCLSHVDEDFQSCASPMSSWTLPTRIVFFFLCRFVICIVVLASTGANSVVKDDHSSSSAEVVDGAKSKSSSMSSSEEGLSLFEHSLGRIARIACLSLSNHSAMDFMVLWFTWKWIFLWGWWRVHSR